MRYDFIRVAKKALLKREEKFTFLLYFAKIEDVEDIDNEHIKKFSRFRI